MLKNLFVNNQEETQKVHCEITGSETTLDNNVILAKIDGIIVLNNFNSPSADMDNKIIKPIDKPPLNFYSELIVPSDIKPIFGRIFAIVKDEDDIEQSTAIMSPKGQQVFSGQKLVPLLEHIKNGIELLEIPSSMLFPVIDTTAIAKTKTCANWKVGYNSVGRKYMYKGILNQVTEKQTFGSPGMLKPGFDIAVSDCSQKNPRGTGYIYKTDGSFKSVDLCSNESAVSFCKNNNAIVYYNDFLNGGKLRVLTSNTESINRNLQNTYLYRSSNI